MTVHHPWRGQLRRCWACSAAGSPYISDGARYRYELAVEAVEAQTGEFSASDVWRTTNGGPPTWSYARYAVYDLEMHGLIRCVVWRADRRRTCSRYELVSPVGYAGRVAAVQDPQMISR